MTSPELLPHWTVPGPPPSTEPTIRPGKVVLGFGAAVLGHIIAGVIGMAGFVSATNDGPFRLIGAGPVAEVCLGVVCIPTGIVWMTRRERGFGLGLLIGWAAGLIVATILILAVFIFLVYWSQGPGK